jgi:nitrate/TMAO reductase-like tetraheme cytochrome c subunit
MSNNWNRILQNIEQCLEMRYVECDNANCQYEGGMTFTKGDKNDYRKCSECHTGIAHVKDPPKE